MSSTTATTQSSTYVCATCVRVRGPAASSRRSSSNCAGLPHLTGCWLLVSSIARRAVLLLYVTCAGSYQIALHCSTTPRCSDVVS